MGIFDDQIRLQKEYCDRQLNDAVAGMRFVVRSGQSIDYDMPFTDPVERAVNVICRYFGLRAARLAKSAVSDERPLESVLDAACLMYRKVKLEGDWQANAMAPLICIRDDGDPIVMLPKNGKYRVVSRTGIESPLNDETASMADGHYAYCFYRMLPERKLGVSDLIAFLLQNISRSEALTYISATLLALAFGMATPYANQIIFEYLLGSGKNAVLLSLLAMLSTSAIAVYMINVFRQMALSKMQGRLNDMFRAAIIGRVLYLPGSFFREHSVGELTGRIQQLGNAPRFICQVVFSVGISSVLSLVYVGQIAALIPGMALPTLLVVAVQGAFISYVICRRTKINLAIMTSEMKAQGVTYALLNGIQQIKLSARERLAFAKWANAYRQGAQKKFQLPTVVNMDSTISACLALAGAGALYAAAYKLGLSLSAYMAFAAAYAMVSAALTLMSSITPTLSKIAPILKGSEPLLEPVPEIDRQKKHVDRLSGSIELNHLSFRYGDDMPYVLRDLNLKVKRGECLAVVGRSGCGKSTLIRLLLGFEKPVEGELCYDHMSLNTLDLASVRRNIGTVLQNGRLMPGTILSNIVLTNPSLTENDAWGVAEIAGIADEIRAMPMGMNTMISEGSNGISGGQRQRILIARAIAGKPPILIFDEATSALDNVTQKRVSEALDELKCTRIIVAHRLSTISNADRIVVLQDGGIIEEGTYDQLMEKQGAFARLVSRQLVS